MALSRDFYVAIKSRASVFTARVAPPQAVLLLDNASGHIMNLETD